MDERSDLALYRVMAAASGYGRYSYTEEERLEAAEEWMRRYGREVGTFLSWKVWAQKAHRLAEDLCGQGGGQGGGQDARGPGGPGGPSGPGGLGGMENGDGAGRD